MDEEGAHISWAFSGEGGDAVVGFSFDGVFQVGAASKQAECLADYIEGVSDLVVQDVLAVVAAKEAVTIAVHEGRRALSIPGCGGLGRLSARRPNLFTIGER